METFVGYFLFWFYFILVFIGVMMSTGCAFLGGFSAYENYALEDEPDALTINACICVSIVGICSTGGLLAMCKFVLSPIYKSLPNIL